MLQLLQVNHCICSNVQTSANLFVTTLETTTQLIATTCKRKKAENQKVLIIIVSPSTRKNFYDKSKDSYIKSIWRNKKVSDRTKWMLK